MEKCRYLLKENIDIYTQREKTARHVNTTNETECDAGTLDALNSIIVKSLPEI